MSNDVETWVTSLLSLLVALVRGALRDSPLNLPDYIETEISCDGVNARIRVDFEEGERTTPDSVQRFLEEQG